MIRLFGKPKDLPKEPAAAEATRVPLPIDLPRGNETVLIAEDEPVIREYLGSILRELGYRVVEAEDGDEALRLSQEIASGRIDLLLTDIVMPKLGGKELAYILGRRSPQTKVIFCSSYPEKLGTRNGMIDPKIPFLQKPLTTSALAHKVRDVLDSPKLDVEQTLKQQEGDIPEAELPVMAELGSANKVATISSTPAANTGSDPSSTVDTNVGKARSTPSVAPRVSVDLPIPETKGDTAAVSGSCAAKTPVPLLRPQQNTSDPKQKIFIVTLGLFASLIVLSAVSFTAFEHFAEHRASQAVSQTQQILVKLQILSGNLHAMESGAQGFAISGKQSHLEQYYDATKEIQSQLSDIKNLLSDDPTAHQQLQKVEVLITEHLATMKEMVDLGSKNVFRAVGQSKLTDQGTTTMQRIGADLEALTQFEQDGLARQSRAASQHAQAVQTTILCGALVACAAILLLGTAAYRLLKGYGRMEAKLTGLLASTPEVVAVAHK
jgi:CHASE3 domain sensor protein/FixJ family two-component response regulator